MGNCRYIITDFANIFKAFIGANYLSMPFVILQGGLALGVVGMALNVLFTQHGCYLIVRGKRTMVRQILRRFDETRERFGTGESERTNLEDRMMDYTQLGNLAEYSFGRPGRWAIEAALAFTQCGFCVIYFIFIGSTIQQLFPMECENKTINATDYMDPVNYATPTTASPLCKQVTTAPDLIYFILTPFPIFLFTTFIRSIRGLGVISIIANIAIFGGWGVITYELAHNFEINPHYELFQLDTLPVFIGMMIPTFEGIGMMMPIENGMKGNRNNFNILLAIAMYVAGTIVTGFGVVGYLKYGPSTQQILIQNFVPGSTLARVVDITLIIGVLFTYPLQNYPTLELVEKWFFAKGIGCCVRTRTTVYDFPNVSDEARLDETASQYESFITSLRMGSVEVLHEPDGAADLTIDASWTKRYLLRTCIVIGQLGLAILLRYLYAYVIAFIGAIGSAFIAFIFPCAVQLKLEWSELHILTKIKSFSIIIISFIASIVAVVGTITTVVNSVQGH